MVITLQNHSGILNSTTGLNAAEPRRTLFNLASKAPLVPPPTIGFQVRIVAGTGRGGQFPCQTLAACLFPFQHTPAAPPPPNPPHCLRTCDAVAVGVGVGVGVALALPDGVAVAVGRRVRVGTAFVFTGVNVGISVAVAVAVPEADGVVVDVGVWVAV